VSSKIVFDCRSKAPRQARCGRQTLASFSKWAKWASGEHKGRRSFSSRQCGWLRQAKFVEDELRKMAGAAMRRQERQPTYRGTSITVGPWLSNPSRSAFANSFSDATRVPGTPRPFAKSTQSRSGRPISNRFRTIGPGSPTPK